MKIDVNGVLVDATPEQEAEIIAFQNNASRDPAPYKTELEIIINSKAREKDYSDAVSCASYVNSTNAQWQAEAQAFVNWRDLVFEYAYEYLDMAQAEEIDNPNINDFIAGIPVLTWPELPTP